MYHHIMIVIIKKHLSSQITIFDLFLISQFLKNIFTDQAEHHVSINHQIYAVKTAHSLHVISEHLELFQQMSQL